MERILLFRDRDLDDSEPFGRVFLIPDAVHVAGAGCSFNVVAFFLKKGKKVCVCRTEFVIRSEHLKAGCLGHFRNHLELDDF